MEPPRYGHLDLLSFVAGKHSGTYKVRSAHLEAEYGRHSRRIHAPAKAVASPLFYVAGTSHKERVRAISIARLWPSRTLHLRPIYVVVYDDPMWRSYLGEGFVLRCFQHLS